MKNKLILLIIAICLVFSISSCENTNDNQNEENNDNILNGVDISKYEKPQTGFLHDGHTLTKLEEMMKYVIEEGEFVFDLYSDGIGYKIVLLEDSEKLVYAFYCVDTLRIVELKVTGKTYESVYTKLNDSETNLQIAYKIVYNSGRRQDFYAIMNCNKQTFNKETVGDYELYRGYTKNDEFTTTKRMVETIDEILNIFNSKITEKINSSLKDVGYSNY